MPESFNPRLTVDEITKAMFRTRNGARTLQEPNSIKADDLFDNMLFFVANATAAKVEYLKLATMIKGEEVPREGDLGLTDDQKARIDKIFAEALYEERASLADNYNSLQNKVRAVMGEYAKVMAAAPALTVGSLKLIGGLPVGIERDFPLIEQADRQLVIDSAAIVEQAITEIIG